MKTRLIFSLIFILCIIAAVGAVMAVNEAGHMSGGMKIASAAFVCIMLLLIVVYRKIVMPLRGIAAGMDLIRAQDFSSRLVKVGQPETDRIVEMFNTMMQSLKTERLRIREQNHFLDLLISVSPMGIVILDSYDRITMYNPAAGDFLGRKELKGLKFSEIDSPLTPGIATMRQGDTRTLRLSDSKIYRCSRLSFMDNGYAHPFILIEQLTREVIKAEKRAYEKVIRMISHEVNNSVAGINSMLSTVASIMKEQPGEESAEMAGIMDACADRCMSMSRFISSYADVVRIPEAKCRMADLNERVLRSRGFLESMCSRGGVEIEFRLTEKPIEVMIDDVLFEQALINIVKNSIEAIRDRSTAALDGTVDDGYIPKHAEYAGRIVIETSAETAPTLTVTDNGAGISPEARSHLFTPFYSSKPDGQGLGLIFISDVLGKHDCRFNLHTSDADGLTRFTIVFPEH